MPDHPLFRKAREDSIKLDSVEVEAGQVNKDPSDRVGGVPFVSTEENHGHPLLNKPKVHVYNDPLNLEHQRTKDMTREEAEQ